MPCLPTSTVRGERRVLNQGPCPLDPDSLLPSTALPAADRRRWHVEIGFGKGRYLLGQARATPKDAFLGVEMVSKYARLLAGRAARQGVDNLTVLCGEALYLLTAYLPRGFADTLHVYFPDPWPKTKHRRRRLFDPASLDLVLGVLRPGGQLSFATDFLRYGERVAGLLADAPQVADLRRSDTPWPDGARTNYEAKYITEGRPILRLTATVGEVTPHGSFHPSSAFHPKGRADILVGPRSDEFRAYAS